MLNLKKHRYKMLLKTALRMNSFLNEFRDENIKNMTKKELKTILYDWCSYEHNYLKMKLFIIKDINNYLYLLEDKEIHFKWNEQVHDSQYNLPQEVKKTIIHEETYIVKDFKLNQIKEIENGLNNKLEKVYQILNPAGFNNEKLDSFYTKFMIMVKKDSIFSKIAEVKKLLLL